MKSWLSTFDDLKIRLRALPYSEDTEFEGCDSDAIASLEAYAGCPFPGAYRSFLEIMGRKSGRLFKGSDATYPGRFELRLREQALKMLERKQAAFVLPENAFVFLTHQGYQFLYFLLNEGDDPPVYHFGERQLTPKKISPHFTEYLSSFVSDLEALAAKHPESFAPL
ncbi:MAG: SMI1/KNR4 family protein [Planctomycetaceae bacterium]